MLSVAFHSLGALSIVIDRAKFSTFIFDPNNFGDFLAWYYKKDERIKVLLVEGFEAAKIARLDYMVGVRIILSESPDKFRETNMPHPIDCEISEKECTIKKLTCKNINQLIEDDTGSLPKCLQTRCELAGSREGKLLRLIKDCTSEMSKNEKDDFKRAVCAKIIGCKSVGKKIAAGSAEWQRLEKFIVRKQDAMFGAYRDVLFGSTVEDACSKKIKAEDLRLVIKYVPFGWHKFSQPLV